LLHFAIGCVLLFMKGSMIMRLLHLFLPSRIIVSLLSVFLLALLFSVAPVAHAQTLSLTCTGADSSTYSPGLTNTPQLVTFTDSVTYGPCVDLHNPTLTGGTLHDSGQAVHSCTNFGLGAIEITVTIPWNNGTHSIVTYTKVAFVEAVDGTIQVVSSGMVISGVGAGDTAVSSLTLATTALAACNTPAGVQSLGGPVILQFLKA
jgi:hypothetical protein